MKRPFVMSVIAPPAPACFQSRSSWIAYLEGAEVDARLDRTPGPLVFQKGQPVTFNRSFPFCDDCMVRHQQRMAAEGRCDRNYLLRAVPEHKEETCNSTS